MAGREGDAKGHKYNEPTAWGRIKHFVRHQEYKLRESWWWIRDDLKDIGTMAKMTIGYKFGQKKPGFFERTSEDRWGHQALQNTEQWIMQNGGGFNEAVAIPLSIWMLNSYYLRKGFEEDLPIAITGKKMAETNRLIVTAHFPVLLRHNPNQTAKLIKEFSDEVKPSVPVKTTLAVKTAYIGDKQQDLDLRDTVREIARKGKEEFIGTYVDDLVADMHTIWKPWFVKMFLNTPDIANMHLRPIGLIGSKYDEEYRNIVVNTWASSKGNP